MESTNPVPISTGAEGERRLWTAVIVQAVQEWQVGALRASREAEKFLFQDELDFQMVCHGAGLNPSQLRSRLARLPKRRDPLPLPLGRHN